MAEKIDQARAAAAQEYTVEIAIRDVRSYTFTTLDNPDAAGALALSAYEYDGNSGALLNSDIETIMVYGADGTVHEYRSSDFAAEGGDDNGQPQE